MIRSMAGTAKIRNKFHENVGARKSQEDEKLFISSDHPMEDQLDMELEAWELASDDDFETFEASLG